MNRRRFVSGLVASTTTAKVIAQSSAPVKRVLVMFKCHLDVGFVDTQAAIIRRYFDDFYPRAIDMATRMRTDGDDRYVWTTGSWLLYSYLKQASPEQAKQMEAAIVRGDIAWHGLPFTWQSELLDRSAITGCIGFSKSLDRRFGRHTSGAKMTDVPGHTRGLVGPLAEAGITFLDIGVNSASTPPDVPALFVWQDVDGKQLTVMYHRTEYGGTVRVPGSDLAVAVEVRDDNTGPHTFEEIKKIYADLRQQFPGASVRAASLTDIAEAITPFRNQFPLLTQEIGDTWIHGVASDPTKLARYRELLRVRAEWLTRRLIVAGDEQDLAFLQNFSLAIEHTWGTDTKTWLDVDHYTPRDLAPMLDTPKYKTVTGSWIEKRLDIDDGVNALAPGLRSEAQRRLSALTPRQPDLSGLSLLALEESMETERFRIRLHAKTGALIQLEDKRTGRGIASHENPLALLTYQTLSKADYDQFLASYITVKTDWAPKDFGKPNIESFGARSVRWNPSVVKMWRGKNRLVAELGFGAQSAEAVTAWPEQVYLVAEMDDEKGMLNLELLWLAKRANRMPEALWLTFQPRLEEPKKWTMKKLEQQVSPFDVVSGGNRHIHAVTGPLAYADGKRELKIESMDAAVVSLGVMSPIYFSNTQPDLSKGFHYSLFNNGWGTNYVQWFGEPARFRFCISMA